MNTWKAQLNSSGLTPMQFAADVWKARQEKMPPGLNKEEGVRWWMQQRHKPVGNWDKHHSLWVPYPCEVRSCCSEMSIPPRNFGWKYKEHCKTARHVAQLFDLDELEFLRYLGKTNTQARCLCGAFRRKDDYLCKRCRASV